MAGTNYFAPGIIKTYSSACFSWHGYNEACYTETEMSSIRYTPLAAEAKLKYIFFFSSTILFFLTVLKKDFKVKILNP